MALSQGNFSAGRFPGMTLSAWVLFKGTGVMVSGYNVASINRTGTGATTVNFANALPSANYMHDAVLTLNSNVQVTCGLSAKTVNGCTVNTFNSPGGQSADMDMVYVAFYS